MIGQALSAAFYIGLVVAFFGSKFLPPNVTEFINNNTMMFYGALFVCNMIGNNLLQSGAFEVFVDGKLVHSKLQSGSLPDVKGLAALIQNAISS